MPKPSDSMKEGMVLTWPKQDGERDRSRRTRRVETDKAVMTVQAELDAMLRIIIDQGTTLAVGTVIARIGSDPEPPIAGRAMPGQDPAPTR